MMRTMSENGDKWGPGGDWQRDGFRRPFWDDVGDQGAAPGSQFGAEFGIKYATNRDQIQDQIRDRIRQSADTEFQRIQTKSWRH